MSNDYLEGKYTFECGIYQCTTPNRHKVLCTDQHSHMRSFANISFYRMLLAELFIHTTKTVYI